jgi:hypothetical protein
LCYIPCPSHPPWLHYSNYTWRGVHVTKLLVKTAHILIRKEAGRALKSRSGCCKEKNLLPLPGIEPQPSSL